MSRFVIATAKATILLGWALTLLLQLLFIPLLAADTVREFPEVGHLRWPGIVGCVAIVMCVQVVMICTWRLLTMVAESRIFDPVALTYVGVMVAACLGASALFAIAYLVLVGAGALGPGVAFLVIAGAGACLGIALVLAVMRSLLTQATHFKQELTEVI